LGLSICRNLVRMMGGEIGVESEEGKGSSFWFTLPLQIADRERLRVPDHRLFDEKCRALVVDDNESSRSIIESYLLEWGVEVECSVDAAGALTALKQSADAGLPFDFCLIDQFMTGIDGWHLASEINSDPALHEMSLFLMSPTGKTGDEAKMKLLNWFAGYISKPVKKDDFIEVLARAMISAEELEPFDDEIEADEESFSVAGISLPVLVAEDHEVNQQLFRTILRNLGIPVVVAANGREAIKLAREGTSLIFMDVQMPEINGYEATRAVRSMGITVPVIAVTASAVKGERERALETGMNDFLTKPFKKQDLIPVLRKWLRPAASSLPATEPIRETVNVEPELIFDIDEAVDTFMGDREMVLELLGTLTRKTGVAIGEMEDALATDDMDSVRASAHSIKGGSMNLSVSRLAKAAEALERAAQNSDRDAAKDAYQVLKARYQELMDYCRNTTLV
jgi:CheY-like chemotaxis protein/HPt (histidine-containing phosphotransfer) domain-containing protein